MENHSNERCTQLVKGELTVSIYRDSFVRILQSSDIFLSMSGTAAEQAIGLGKPVIQLSGYGPQFTSSFAEAQRRLLGPTIFCADGKVGAESTLRKTAYLVLDVMHRFKNDQTFARQCQLESVRRLGPAGGGKKISGSISKLISQLP